MLRKFGAVIDNNYIKPLCAILYKNNKYKCPDCNDSIILKNGKIRSAHFSHRIKCNYNTNTQLIELKNKIEIDGILLNCQCINCIEQSQISISPLNIKSIIVQDSSIIVNYNNKLIILEFGYIEHKNQEWYKIVTLDNKYIITNYVCNDCKYGQVYFNQRGAGCGKTYESIQLLNKFKNKKVIIYLTKTHSAKEVIYGELKEQYSSKQIHKITILSETLDKKYKIVIKREDTNEEFTILIGTIDSFTYTIYDKSIQINNLDPFNDIVNKIHEGKIVTNINYGNTSIHINYETLIIIDEAQDLGKNYMEAFITIVNKTKADLYIIGDKLQSIWNTNNIYTCIEEADITKITKSDGINKVMRFHNEQFKYFVNSLVPYHKYNLPKVEQICDRACKYEHESIIPYTIFEVPSTFRTDIDDMYIIISKIKTYICQEITKYDYKPNNFMFIFPILKKNTFAQILSLELNNFWTEKYNKRDKYVFLHKSEPGQIINLKESENATRILSIHTSKGTGCEVVFLLGVTEHSLNIFSRQTDNIVYNSLLHVAVTRQKKAIYVGIENNNDDICRRFKRL
jgi:hypothetical protein